MKCAHWENISHLRTNVSPVFPKASTSLGIRPTESQVIGENRVDQTTLDLTLHLDREGILNEELYLDSFSYSDMVQFQKKLKLCVFLQWQWKGGFSGGGGGEWYQRATCCCLFSSKQSQERNFIGTVSTKALVK